LTVARMRGEVFMPRSASPAFYEGADVKPRD
jgi:hypothetical protein